MPLSIKDFDIKTAQSFVILTDWEPDDAMFIVAFLRYLGNKYGKEIPPVAIISGGAKAAIQNERAKKYVDACVRNVFLMVEAEETIEFIRGANSDQTYHKQGADVLSEVDLSSINRMQFRKIEEKPETDKIKKFLSAHPKSMVFGLKRPDEFLGDKELLSFLRDATLVTYTGGYNYQLPADKTEEHQKNAITFFKAFKKVGLVQNFHMLQGGEAKDETPRDILRSHTPNFTRYLRFSAKPTATAIKQNIRLWNERILLGIKDKLDKFDAKKGGDHAAGIAKLKIFFAQENIYFEGDYLREFQKGIVLLDSTDPEIGYRKQMWLNIIEDINTQTVLADQLVAFAVLKPEIFSSDGIAGEVTFNAKGFIEVKPLSAGSKQEATILSFPVIKGKSGKPEKGVVSTESRIGIVDHLLCELVLGIDELPLEEARRKFLLSASSPVNTGVDGFISDEKVQAHAKRKEQIRKIIFSEMDRNEDGTYTQSHYRNLAGVIRQCLNIPESEQDKVYLIAREAQQKGQLNEWQLFLTTIGRYHEEGLGNIKEEEIEVLAAYLANTSYEVREVREEAPRLVV